MVHVSQLKKQIPPQATLNEDIEEVPSDPEEQLTPIAILDRKFIRKAGSTAPRAQVQWTNMGQGLATWEDEADVRCRFPQAPARGQAVSKGGGNVTRSGDHKPDKSSG
jgi:hypothetical protein